MPNFLIASPGRTGSTFLTNYIKNLLDELNYEYDYVLQTHDATLQLEKDTVVLHCRRRNLWLHTLSSVIAHKRNEWVQYTECLGSFKIDLDDFENKYVWNLRWFEAFSYYTDYPNRIDLFFEDFVENHTIINRALGFPEISVKTNTTPSSDLKDKIENLQELKSFFHKLESDKHLHTFPVTERCWNPVF